MSGKDIQAMENPLLQPDILEVIFPYLDGKSLAESSQVCSTWKNVIRHISVVTNVWKQCCEAEIPEDVFIDITTNLYPCWTSASEDNTKWHVVYLNWLHWQNVKDWPYVTREVYSTENRKEHITCVKISGSCIITGHLYGGIHAWSCHKSHLGVITTHLEEVTDLGLICLSGKRITKHPDWKMKHDYVVSTSVDHTIKVTPLCRNAKPVAVLRVHMGPTTTVRVYKSMFVVLGEDEFMTIWNLTENDSLIKPALVHRRRDVMKFVQAVSVWKGKITGITISNHFYCLKSVQDTEIVNAEFEGPQKFAEKNSHILRKYIWRHWICAWLTGHHQMYVTVGASRSSRKYNPMAALHSYPVCLLLYGELFLMGMESGTLFMYRVKAPEDLLKLDLKAYCWSHSLSPEPIISLDIADSVSEPTIVAATTDTLYYIALYPPD